MKDPAKDIATYSKPPWLWPALAMLAAVLLALSSLLGRIIEVNCGTAPSSPTQCMITSHGLLFDWSSDSFGASDAKNAYVGTRVGPDPQSPTRVSLTTLSLIVELKDPTKTNLDIPDYSYFSDSDRTAEVAGKIRTFIQDPASGPVHETFGEHGSAVALWLVLLGVIGGGLVNWKLKTLRVSLSEDGKQIIVQCYGFGSQRTGTRIELMRDGIVNVHYDANNRRFVARYSDSKQKVFPELRLGTVAAEGFAGRIMKLLELPTEE